MNCILYIPVLLCLLVSMAAAQAQSTPAATDPEIEKIVDYLAKNFGPKVNVNKATADQLAGTLEVPKAAASAIVEYREKNGSFKSFEDLRKVPAIDWSALESKKDRLDFSEGK